MNSRVSEKSMEMHSLPIIKGRQVNIALESLIRLSGYRGADFPWISPEFHVLLMKMKLPDMFHRDCHIS